MGDRFQMTKDDINCANDEDNNNNNNNSTNNNNNLDFLEGIRVLAVDDNTVCLTVLRALLNKCGYHVTSLRNKTEALALLKSHVDDFDIVLTNVNIDEMDGFKFLEVGLEFDIPVVMISASESTSLIMKGVQHGAVDYLIKPVRFEAVQTIWQHVVRKNMRASRGDDQVGRLSPVVGALDRVGEGRVDMGTENNKVLRRIGNKRKIESTSIGDNNDDDNDNGNNNYDAGECSNPSVKRERVKWTKERHEKFLNAVNMLGGEERAVPKKILELINEPGLTREKVASHLQKFRKSIKQAVERANISSHNSSNNNNGYVYGRFMSSHSMGSGFVHRPVVGNDTSRGLVFGQGRVHQPNIHDGPMMRVLGSYAPQMPAQPMLPDRPSYSNLMPPVVGNFMGPVSSSFSGQPSQQLLPFENSFLSKMEMSAPDDLFFSPNMINPTAYDAFAFDILEKNDLLDLAEEFSEGSRY